MGKTEHMTASPGQTGAFCGMGKSHSTEALTMRNKKHLIFVLSVCLLCVSLLACAAPGGQAPEGQAPEGQAPEGCAPGGRAPAHALATEMTPEATGDSAAAVRPVKNPELAGALSVFVPGLGHIYAGETVKGCVLTGLFVTSIGLVIGADIGPTHDSITPWGWASVAFLGGVYLYSLIDAPFAAIRTNERSGDRAHLIRLNAGSTTITLDAGIAPRGACAAIRVTL